MSKTLPVTSVSDDEDRMSGSLDGLEFIANDTNNSMPMADKPYDPPVMPEEIDAYTNGLGAAAKNFRETFRPERRDFTTLFLRIRRKHFEQLLWQLISTGVISKEKMYMPECLPYWTIGVRLRVRNIYPLGRLIEATKCRLGITNPGLKFCIDGFFGMVNYSDIFGSLIDVCPWMEISSFSTVASLRLMDGDSIFVNIASAGQIENVLSWRKKRSVELGTVKSSAPPARAADAESEENQVIG